MKRLTEKQDVVVALESEDGVLSYDIRGISGDECTMRCKEIYSYEASAKGVIVDRLMRKGVLRRVERWSEEEDRSVPEYWFIDMLMDAERQDAKYYVFEPETQEDVDMLSTLRRMIVGSDSGGADNPYRMVVAASECVPHGEYALCLGCDGEDFDKTSWFYIFDMGKLIESAEKWCAKMFPEA